MTDTWTLTWDGGPRIVSTANPEEFVTAVREAAKRSANTGVVLELLSPSGAEMTVGFGQPSIATFKADQNPPYYVSHGSGSSDETLVFFRRGHHSEFGGDAGISAGDALNAVMEFITTGERPACIAWREV